MENCANISVNYVIVLYIIMDNHFDLVNLGMKATPPWTVGIE